MNLALIICVLVVLGSSIGFALLRGLPKTRIRGIRNLVCFGLAFLATILVKGSANLTATVSTALENAVEDASTSQVVQTILADGSVVGFVSALLAPLLFLIFFIGLEILTGIAYIIVMAIVGKKLHKSECDAPLKTLRAILWAVLSAILVLVVLIAPLSAYSGYVKIASEAIPEDVSYAEAVGDAANSAAETEDTIVIKTHRALFGWLDTTLASFKVGGVKTNVKKELPVLAASVADIEPVLENGDLTDPKNADAIRRIADRMENAPLLSSLLGTVVYTISDEYVKDASNASEPIPYAVMTILHNDANDPAKLRADFYTLSDVLVIYGTVDGDNYTSAALNSFLKAVQSNPNMKPLLDEIDRMARELINETVSLGKETSGEYSNVVVSTVEEFNDIAKLPKSEQKAKVVECMEDLLDDANGLDATDKQIDYFADVVVNELIPEQGGEITPASAETFLVDYINEHWEELVEKGIIEID